MSTANVDRNGLDNDRQGSSELPSPSSIDVTEQHGVSDLDALPHILAALKRTSCLLGPTFTALGQQASKAAELGSATEYMNQIHSLEQEMSEKHETQERLLGNLKALVDAALDAAFVKELKAKAQELVVDAIESLIAERVKQELLSQVPQALKEQAAKHRRQILQVQTDLCNSEARHYNSSVHRSATALTVPLRPLLRPLPTPAQSPAYLASSHRPWNSYTIPPTPVSAVNTAPQANPFTSTEPAITEDESDDLDESDISLEVPTPSQYFPLNLEGLVKMGDKEAECLVRDYGLTDAHSPSVDVSREDNLNKFMDHIGVPYKMVPPPKTKAKKALSMLPPLIIDCK